MNASKLANDTKVKARELRKTLYLCAKENTNRRFHALYDKVYRPDILAEAWRKVQANKGSGGVDRQTIQQIVTEYGEARFLNELYVELKRGNYRPRPVRRTYIEKGNGHQRPLGIPTIKDRVAQMAVKLVIEPIFEADFKDCSYGFRPKRSAHQAVREIKEVSKQSHWAVDIDIQGYFDSINHEKLMKLVEQRVSDRKILKLIRKWIKAGVMEDNRFQETRIGAPQGGVISPLLANIYLDMMDTLWEKRFGHLGKLIRYADDFVIMCWSKESAMESIKAVKAIMDKLELHINREKSKLVDLQNGREGFDFLGLHHRKYPIRKKGGITIYVMSHVPSKKAMQKMRTRIKEYTKPRNKLFWEMKDMVEGLNPILRGFRNYYLLSPKGKKWLKKIDWYVQERLTLFWNKKKNKGRRHVGIGEVWRLTKYALLKLTG